jgi:hypothetical protein
MLLDDIKLLKDEYDPHFEQYISCIEPKETERLLEEQVTEIVNLFFLVDEEGGLFKYAEGKWSIKEVLGHMCDAERVFTYRILCISRNEQAVLPAYDENEYVRYANFNQRTLISLVEEIKAVRQSTIHLLNSLSEEQLMRRGLSGGRAVTVRALIYVLLGHFKHHVEILKTRYNI